MVRLGGKELIEYSIRVFKIRYFYLFYLRDSQVISRLTKKKRLDSTVKKLLDLK